MKCRGAFRFTAEKGSKLIPYENMTRVRRSWPWWRWVLTGLSVLALGLSAFLCWHYLTGGSVIGCSAGGPCEQVLSSRWSAIGGVVPVSGLAMGAYMAMLAAILFIGPATQAPVRRLAWCAMLVVVGAAAGSAVWFTILQKWVIGGFCPYCMAAHITGLLLAVFVIWRALMEFDDVTDTAPTNPATAAPRRLIGRVPAIGLVLVGLALAGFVAVCQIVIAPQSVYDDGESLDTLPAIDPHTVPLVGSPDAPYVVTLLFDYRCTHCQHMHFMLDEAVRRYGGTLAFALCPAPLDSQCNPYVLEDTGGVNDSCDLARVALAVWVADREAFPAFELYIFSVDSGDRWHPRSLDAARAKAVELVGQEKFDAAWADPWIDQHLQTSVRISGETGGAVPKLVYGSRWVTPQLYSADDLVWILKNSLAVPMP